MAIYTKHNPYPELKLHLNNQAIERVNDITFIGIRISVKLSWNIHIDVICKKARRIIGLIHRNFHLAPEHLRHILYINLVCPILEYSCATLHPLNKTLTNRSESVQRSCLPGHTAVLELGTWWSSFPNISFHPRSSSWLLNCGSCLLNSCLSLFCSQCLYSSHSFWFKA